MSKFERKFFQRDWHDYPVVMALLDKWALPGKSSSDLGLRLAVRRNYVNFYRKGQSVAKLHSSSRSTKLSVHWKYTTDEENRPGKKDYIHFDENWLRDNKNAARVADWISRTKRYWGAEKSYVDRLVAANPGTMDLEMGLSAYNGAKRAPRMDLVVVEERGKVPSLAFWEAKCADNSEARANGTPRVVSQVEGYELWMRNPDARCDVVDAYRNAAEISLQLAESANKPEGRAQEIWRYLVEANEVEVIERPGLVIGGYTPGDHPAGNSKQIETKAESFLAQGKDGRLSHKDRLKDEFGITLEYHKNPGKAATPLPPLGGVQV